MKKYSFTIMLISLGFLLMSYSAKAQTFQIGDVFAAVSNGQVQHHDATTGTLLATLDCGFGGFTTGMAFDSDDNLYVTEFSNVHITVFAGPSDPHTILQRINTGDLGDQSCESIVFDAAGNFYVGHADGNDDIHQYNSAGTRSAVYDVAIDGRGSDWIDLAADQMTIFYTSEGRQVLRYDVVADMQLTDFATLPGSGTAFALRILSDGGILVADRFDLKRLDATGTVIQTYDVAGEDTWFSLNLDPDHTSFWAGNFGTGMLYKFDIDLGGPPLQTINTGAGANELFGVTIFGEITAAENTPVAFDIKPQSCPNPLNVKNKGTIPVAILGTADFDVNDIDVSTVQLEGVDPLRSSIEDESTPVTGGEQCECTTDGPDGFDDLTLKFDAQDIVDALGPVSNGDELELTITGSLLDGTPFEGSDCVIIKAKGLGKDLSGNSSNVPEEYALFENFPNPFNPSTTIQFAIPEQSFVKLDIYNSLGERVTTLVAETLAAGIYSFNWNATYLPSGVYIYSIQSKDFFESKKMILMK